MLHSLVAKFLHGQAEMNLHAVGGLQRGVLSPDEFQHLRAVHGGSRLVIDWFAEAGADHLAQVLLLHVVLVQLLNTCHLSIVEPVGSLHFTQFMHYLGVELFVRYVARVVNKLSFGNGQTDVAARARGVSQRVRIVRGGYERGIAGLVLL